MSAASIRRAARAATALVALIAGLSAFAPAAVAETAQVGVSLSTGAVAVDGPVRPGEEIVLPSISVLNPGDVPSTYRLAVESELSGSAQAVPTAWLELDRDEVRVEPGGAAPFRTRLVVPASADPGRYEVVVSSTLASTVEGAGGTGAASGVRITFEVASTEESAAPAERTVPSTDPYAAPRGSVVAPALLLGGALLTGLVWALLRRRRGGELEGAS